MRKSNYVMPKYNGQEVLEIKEVFLIDKYDAIKSDLKINAIRFKSCKVHCVEVKGILPVGCNNPLRCVYSTKKLGLSYKFQFNGNWYGFNLLGAKEIKEVKTT